MNIGQDSAFTVNTPTTVDTHASTMLAPTAAGDKGVVVQALPSQTGNLQEWQNSSGATTLFVGPDGTLQTKDTTNGHTYRISITNGALVLIQTS